jgi:hypothetical protein
MPYTRPIRRFHLTPPSVPIFLISVVLALLAVFTVYGHLSIFKASTAFLVLLILHPQPTFKSRLAQWENYILA